MRIRSGVSVLLLVLIAVAHQAETISHAEIVARTLKATPNCLDWQLTGLCFWKKCDLLGCTVSTSPKVSHFVPDLLVSVYSSHDHYPIHGHQWETEPSRKAVSSDLKHRVFNSPLGLGTGHVSNQQRGSSKRNLRFFEATIVGHPGIEFVPQSDLLLCPPITEANRTYYESVVDAYRWRFDVSSSFTSEPPSHKHNKIGNPDQTWGYVYPRSGFIHQPSPPKAAAVIAHRACDIVLNDSAGHISQSLNRSHPHIWTPDHINADIKSTGIWQMISPVVDSDCTLFQDTSEDWDHYRMDSSQSFVWNLWRRYTCCLRQPGKLVDHVDF